MTMTAYRATLKGMRWQQGFSLIELMVGVAVALIATVVVMQIFQVSEGQRRNTTGGDDAQTNGAMAVSMIQRELQQAGSNLSNTALMTCNMTLPTGRVMNNVSPVMINSADVAPGDAGTDTLRIAYGNSNGLPEGTRIAAALGSTYSVASAGAFALDDWVVSTPDALIMPTVVGACGAVTLTQVNVVPDAASVQTAAAATNVDGILHNLGSNPVLQAYSVRGGRLMVCNARTQDCGSTAAANWTALIDGVVSLRAEYGEDTTATPPKPAAPPMPMRTVDVFNQTTPNTGCGWLRRLAIRFVVVVRSGQFDKDYTAPTPTWAGSVGAPIAITGTDWQRYRYKTFETAVPLRNIAWQPANSDQCP